jgi:RNA polymerase sigma factor (sigma-70 family)
MNENQSPRSLTDRQYVQEVYAALQRIHGTGSGRQMHGEANRQDIVQNCMYRVWRKREDYMEKYPVPAALAHALARTADKDFARSERIQNGQGAALRTNPDGSKAPGRTVVSFDAHLEVHGDQGVPTHCFDSSITDSSVDPEFLTAIRRKLQSLPLVSRRLVLLVDMKGLTVKEAAEQIGISREHASRTLSTARKALRSLRP